MNILLLTAHSVAEYDDMRMFSDLGYDVFSIGSYTRPAQAVDPIRPPLPDAPYFPDLADMVEGDQMEHKLHLPDGLIDWADAIICHHYVDMHPVPGGLQYPGWITGQWERIKHKRVIWRTCGQSDSRQEAALTPFVRDGLEVVRYSPKEQEAFTQYGYWAGQSALIRFGKYVDDYGPWTGDEIGVLNISQGLFTRGEFTHGDWWIAATEGLPKIIAGPESAEFGGGGPLPYPEMLERLRRGRVYLYTGTQPASYTLGLMEAALSGIPVVSIDPSLQWMPHLFEGHEIAFASATTPREAHDTLESLLADDYLASIASAAQLALARQMFDVRKIGQQWLEFLGAP